MCGDLIYCPGILLIMADRVTTVVSIKGYEIIFLIVVFEVLMTIKICGPKDIWLTLIGGSVQPIIVDKCCVAFSLATRIDFIAHLQAKVR